MTIDSSRESRCDPSGLAYAGSQRQICLYVNQKTPTLSQSIETAIGQPIQPRWVSPLQADRYREYKDHRSLEILGLSMYRRQLQTFWPTGGPRWDALACFGKEKIGILLVEAKSHVSEMYAGGCKATADCSLRKIEAALARTSDWLGSELRWRDVHEFQLNRGRRGKGSLYQMANRIAHLYFLRAELGFDAWLVNLYFTNDPHSPTTPNEWAAALTEAKRSLGAAKVPFAVDLFLPAIR